MLLPAATVYKNQDSMAHLGAAHLCMLGEVSRLVMNSGLAKRLRQHIQLLLLHYGSHAF